MDALSGISVQVTLMSHSIQSIEAHITILDLMILIPNLQGKITVYIMSKAQAFHWKL